MVKSNLIKKYFLPGFISQSIIISGGYGTGRELIEFFLKHGPQKGILGILLVTLPTWVFAMVLTWEFARMFKAYDYRTFFKKLLGKGWFTFEIIYVALLFIVLGVLSSAAGAIFRDFFNLPYFLGAGMSLLCVVILAYSGSKVVSTVLLYWSYVLYAVFGVLWVVSVSTLGFSFESMKSPGWGLDGFRYALYNLGCMAGVLFVLDSLETRKEAVLSGLLSGFLTVIPGVFLLMAMSTLYPEIVGIELPVYYFINRLEITPLLYGWVIVLFGTLIETGTGFIHAINERVNSYILDKKNREMKSWLRAIITLLMIGIGATLSSFGLIDLISYGYGMISWAFLFVYILPLSTLGVRKMVKSKRPVTK